MCHLWRSFPLRGLQVVNTVFSHVFVFSFCVHGGVTSTFHNPLQLLNRGQNWLAVQLRHLQPRDEWKIHWLVRFNLDTFLILLTLWHSFFNTGPRCEWICMYQVHTLAAKIIKTTDKHHTRDIKHHTQMLSITESRTWSKAPAEFLRGWCANPGLKGKGTYIDQVERQDSSRMSMLHWFSGIFKSAIRW